MIHITGEQLNAAAAARFERQLIEAIADGRDDVRRTLSAPQGRAELRAQQRRAAGYGLRSELDVARYVITAWLLGPDFDERFPAMREVLSAPQLAAADKADAIERIAATVLAELDGST